MSDINKLQDLGPRWYVAHTFSGYEQNVKKSLEKIVENRGLGNLIFDIQIPIETVITKDGDKEKVSEHRIFPCYVYIKMVMNDATWHAVRTIPGVTGFVGPGSRPTPITEEEVRALGLEDTAADDAEKKVSLAFGEGDTVRVVSGLFEGYTGTVQSISADLSMVTVLVNRGRRAMPVELEASCLEPENA